MKKIFSSDVKRRISEYKYADIGIDMMHVASGLVKTYDAVYEPLRALHPKYRGGWHSSFLSDHRFMNRVIMQMILDGILSTDDVYLDVGCYDGMLPAVLFEYGINAYGEDDNEWLEMWNLLNISDAINNEHLYKNQIISIVTMLNYCHNWKPEEIRPYVGMKLGYNPKVILMDRETRTPHPNNKYWMDDALLASLGIDVVKLPGCRVSKDSDRDLLIMEL